MEFPFYRSSKRNKDGYEMVKCKLTSKSELPKWFDLSKYDRAADLDLFGWFWMLRMNFLNRMLRGGVVPVDPGDPYLELLFQIWETPIKENSIVFGSLEEKAKAEGIGKGSFRGINTIEVTDAFGIWSFINNNEELLQLHKTLDDADWAFEVYDEHAHKFCADYYQYDSLKRNDNFILAQVNLNLSDKILLAQFKKWLSDVRERYPLPTKAKRSFTQSDMKSWCKYQVLPYIHLSNWASFAGVAVPWRVYGQALFPDDIDDIDPSEAVRKTTARYAAELQRNDVLHSMQYQVSVELAEALAEKEMS